MSVEYDNYLNQHRANVYKGFVWIKDNLPEILNFKNNLDWQIEYNHDKSKNDPEEYDAYDKYFYGNNRSYYVVQDFNIATDASFSNAKSSDDYIDDFLKNQDLTDDMMECVRRKMEEYKDRL